MDTTIPDEISVSPPKSGGILLGAATVFALMSATCCVLPIGLSILGLGGAWLSVFGPFTAYRSIILIGVAMIVCFAWVRLIRRRRSGLKSRSALVWTILASAALAVSVSAPFWESEASRALWAIWMDTR